jgi:predicted DNA-binding protein YlxM (UPF0122 family)
MVSMKMTGTAIAFWSVFVFSVLNVDLSNSFMVTEPPTRRRCRLMLAAGGRRQNMEIPLLDLKGSEYADKIITPLPSSHLPNELRTIHLYGMELRRPIHKMLVEHAIEHPTAGGDDRLFGHLVTTQGRNDDDSLVGVIGCTAEILINAKEANPENAGSDLGDDVPITVLCRGSFRFRVREVIKTFPYPVAIVDEFVDDEVSLSASNKDEVDDDDDDPYATLDTPDLVRRIFVGLRSIINQKLQKTSMSPLEQAILQDSGVNVANAEVEKSQAEEMAAVLEVFQSSLIDIAPMPVDRYFAIGMMAAEMADFDNVLREELLCMTDGVARLRLVLEEVERKVSLNQAKKVADETTDKVDEIQKDLKVGQPELPKWAKSLSDGTRVEYFWNEEYGWCSGVVVGQTEKIVDEIIVTVRFDDGEVHRLPLTADEKIRWRPPKSS